MDYIYNPPHIHIKCALLLTFMVWLGNRNVVRQKSNNGLLSGVNFVKVLKHRYSDH